MATPSSSTTSPSPPMAYLPHAAGSQQSSMTASSDGVEREQRKKAVQKFLARAEISMVTRALRARLSYASYKATHNIPHVSLRDLEAQTQSYSQTASFHRTIAAKRKTVGATNYYNNPATQGAGAAGASGARRTVQATMPPPTTVSASRTIYPNPSNPATYLAYNEVASGSRSAAQAPNLYSSILAPPSAKQARTIHNANDPPVPAPSRPAPSPRSRVPKASPRNEAIRSHTKSKHGIKSAKVATSPERRKTKRSSLDKGKGRQKTDVDADGDVDMKAAATLTSLLMHHHRPSLTGSASSPRSSIDGSEIGSAYSYSHFAQSSARTNPPAPISAAPSTSTVAADSILRSNTPPPSYSNSMQHTTPRAAPTDNEAADLMLFLATSPSPVRPANKDSRDMAAYRALGGAPGPLRSKGRILFPSTPAADPSAGHEDVSAAPAGTFNRTPALSRGGDPDFTSSISSIGTDLGGRTGSGSEDQPPGVPPPASVVSSPPAGPSLSTLLPSAPLPLLPSAPASPSRRREIPSPKPVIGGASGSLDFNIHEFIHASPSPSQGPPLGHGGGGHKPNLGLRADVGRKLFEEEQMRHAHALHVAAAAAMGSPGRRQEERGLGAGIDLVQS